MDHNLTVEDTSFLLFCLGMTATMFMNNPDRGMQNNYFRVLRKVGDLHERLNGWKQQTPSSNN